MCEGHDSPVRLPENRASDFVHHFNRIYKGVGMKLTVQPDSEPKKTDQTGGVRLLKRSQE